MAVTLQHPGRDASRLVKIRTKASPILSIDFDWIPVGSVSLDANGRLKFPHAPKFPGLYQFKLIQSPTPHLYTGQADNLARRMQHYRTPGKSQQTNIRLNRLMIDTLTDGGRISVSIITSGATVDISGNRRPIDLNSKLERVLLEHVAISVAIETGAIILNK